MCWNGGCKKPRRCCAIHGGASRKIADIAAAAGFNDLSYFNRTFRRHYDATPSAMRATAGQGD